MPRRMIRFRELLGLTQKVLAEKAAIGRSTVSDLESGLIKNVNLSTVLAIVAVFDATPDQLLGFDKRLSVCEGCRNTAQNVTTLHEGGRSTPGIATLLGLHESSVEQILEAEYQSRRLRRF